MTQRGPWPTRLEWRAVGDRVRLVEIVEMDIGPAEVSRLDLSPGEASALLAQSDALLTAVAKARRHGRPANDSEARAT